MKKSLNIAQLVCIILSALCYSLFTIVSAKILGFSFMAQNGLQLSKVNFLMKIPYIFFFAEIFLVIYRQTGATMVVGVLSILFISITTAFMAQVYLSGEYKHIYELFVQVGLPILRKVEIIPEEYNALLSAEGAEELIKAASKYFKRGDGFWGMVLFQAAFVLTAPLAGQAKQRASVKSNSTSEFDDDIMSF